MSLIKHYKNTDRQFGWVAITLHWLIALCVIGLYFLGDYMMGLTYYDSFYTIAPKIHEALGITIFLLMVFRVVWTLQNTTPTPPATNSSFINLASKLAHLALYIMTFVILISGLLISFAGGQGIEIFNLFIIPGLKHKVT
jgi:cytochrome b561